MKTGKAILVSSVVAERQELGGRRQNGPTSRFGRTVRPLAANIGAANPPQGSSEVPLGPFDDSENR